MKLLIITKILALGAALSIGMAHAVTVNVDFGAAPGSDYTGVGVAPDTGTTWNHFNSGGGGALINIPTAALVDSTGGASGVSLATGTTNQRAYSGGGGGNLLVDYLYNQSATSTINLSGLTPNAAFSLYLYGNGDNTTQASTFTLNAANGGATGRTFGSNKTDINLTYVKLNGTADGSGNVSLSWTAAPSTTAFGPFNGFQLDLNPNADTTPPTLVSIAHNKGAGPVLVNEPVTYTVTFSEPMSPPTVNADDFGNTAATAITIDSVTPTADPAVFTVVVTPTGTGSLQLQINAGATLSDLAALPLDATNAIPDDIADILQVEDLPPTPTTITVVSSSSPTTYGQTVTFTATVDPIPSGGTVQFLDGINYIGDPVAVNTTTGLATYTTNTLAVASYSITADYSGNFAFAASSSAAPISQTVDKAQLTVTASNAFRAPNTANPEPFLYQITGYQNGENLASSGVTGTPELTTTAVLSSSVGDYPITCAQGTLAADNYSFALVHGTLTVAELANTFSVNFFVGPAWPFGGLDPNNQSQIDNVKVAPGMPAGFGDWFTSGWENFLVPWAPTAPLAPATLTSNKGATATFTFKDCRNGWTYSGGPRTTLLGDGNGNLMDAHVNSTLDPGDGTNLFDMEVTNIPFAAYDVIFYIGANAAQYGDGTGVIKFNGGAERAFKLQSGAFTGTFTEMTDATTPGNYIVFTGVTGSSFTTQTWGTGPNGFNHLGPCGFQIREAALPPGFSAWANANNAANQTPDQDHDNDGVENGVEYFMGQTGSSFTAMPGLDGSNTVTWTMDAGYAGTYEVQTSPDLVNWTNVDPKPLPSGSTLSYTLPSGLGKRFVRLLVTPAQ